MSRKSQNRARAFNSRMHFANESWAAHVLGMDVNPEPGIDLLGERAGVETKFCLRHSGKYTHLSWRVLDYQMKYEGQTLARGKTPFWGLAKYWLKVPVQEISVHSSEELERLVERREMFIVQWSWMNQFPSYHQSGKTETSEWDHRIRFPKGRLLPRITASYKVKKGSVHLTRGVSDEYFPAFFQAPF